MAYSWQMPDIAAEKDPAKLSPWLFVALFVLAYVIGGAWRLMTWPGGKAVDHSFWLGLLLPAIAWGVLCGCLLAYRDVSQKMVDCWNIQRQRYAFYRQQWAQQHWVVMDAAVLTPEPDLAERLSGLEGTAPENPGKTLPLSLGIDGTQDRATQLLTQLLTPLAASIQAVSKIAPPKIYLQGGGPEDARTLKLVWQQLKLPAPADTVLLDPNAPLLHASQQEGLAPVNVVLSYQLWKGSDDTPTYSELGAALVIISPENAGQIKLQSRTMLMRPIEAPVEQIEDTLTTLLQGRQTDWARLKHVWVSQLDKPTHNALRTALQDMAPTATLHDLDHAIGKPGVAGKWVLQAVAAQMIRHGQGDQLVVGRHGRQAMTCNLVTSKPLLPSSVETLEASLFSSYFFGVLILICAAAGCLQVMQGKPLSAILPDMACFVCIFFSLQIILTVFVLRNVRKQFWQRAFL